MKERLKVLYKDESGELILDCGVGPCNIYIINNINEYTKNFIIVSKDKRFYATYSIDNIRLCDTITWDDYSWKIAHYKKIHKQIYNYITKRTDSNGTIKWYNMKNCVEDIPKYNFNDEESGYIDDKQFTFIYNKLQTFVSVQVKLDGVEYVVENYNDFIYFPIFHVRSIGSAKFDCMIRLDTLEFFGGDKLTRKQEKELILFLNSADPHYPIDTYLISMYYEWNDAYRDLFNHNYPIDEIKLKSVNKIKH